jgi:hypothetical protein
VLLPWLALVPLLLLPWLALRLQAAAASCCWSRLLLPSSWLPG